METNLLGANPTEWYNNPNFWSALAGFGGAVDPEGIGGRLGKAAQMAIMSQAQQVRAQEQAKIQNEQNAQTKLALNLLAQHGGLSPKESPGVTSMQATPEGLKMEVTPPIGGQASMTPGAIAPAATPGTTPGVAPTPAPFSPDIQRINSILPFYLAPLR